MWKVRDKDEHTNPGYLSKGQCHSWRGELIHWGLPGTVSFSF